MNSPADPFAGVEFATGLVDGTDDGTPTVADNHAGQRRGRLRVNSDEICT